MFGHLGEPDLSTAGEQLYVGGAIGNLADRVAFGSVRDFLVTQESLHRYPDGLRERVELS